MQMLSSIRARSRRALPIARMSFILLEIAAHAAVPADAIGAESVRCFGKLTERPSEMSDRETRLEAVFFGAKRHIRTGFGRACD